MSETIDIFSLNDWASLWLEHEDIVRRTAWEEERGEGFITLTLYEAADGFQFEEFVQIVILDDGSWVSALALRALEGEAIQETLWNPSQVTTRLNEEERLMRVLAEGRGLEGLTRASAFEEQLKDERRERLERGNSS